MVHSVPIDQVQKVTKELRNCAAYVFVTDLSTGIYSKFGASWNDFVTTMAEDEDTAK
jgi:hypothetical protein